MPKTAFTGGALSFKGDGGSSKKKNKNKAKKNKKSKKSKHSLREDGNVLERKLTKEEKRRRKEDDASIDYDEDDDELTEAEKRAIRFKEGRQLQELEKTASKSHRERVEEFNEKLSQLTELNDIPRVSVDCLSVQALCAFFCFRLCAAFDSISIQILTLPSFLSFVVFL